MSESCSGTCSSCSEECGSREPESLLAPAHPQSNVKKIIGVVSGKGGVGKSTVTALLASAMNRAGKKSAVLDADITGPSIPKVFGVTQCREAEESGIIPAITENGVQIMSINLLLDDETSPVIWRGPVLAGVVKQFWSDVIWGDVDYLFVDMPPGTGDVPLTVFQSLPIDGVIIVTTPQDLVSMIVAKAVNMAKMMKIPVIGFVENYSYFQCPDCDKKVEIFGKSHIDELATEHGIPVLARLPIEPQVALLCDRGQAEDARVEEIMPAVELLLNM